MATKNRAIALMIICTFITAAGQLFLKAGTNAVSSIISVFNFNLIFGAFLYFIGAIILIIALKYGELSVLYPIFATSYVWVSVFSPIYFSDFMNTTKWAGIVLIIIGVTLMGFGSNSKGGLWQHKSGQ